MAFSVFSSFIIHPQLWNLIFNMSLFDSILFSAIHFVDKLGVWHRLPVILGIIYLAIRRHLHQRYNLLHVGGINGLKYDTKQFSYRTADGKCNHPTDDTIGSQGTFFGRNMPPSSSPYG
ncbi:alpha-dioxygenase 2-like [Hevea brasiliensis]|nr:alpha-dioxygenase 2-like [Hevea brasiliensis]